MSQQLYNRLVPSPLGYVCYLPAYLPSALISFSFRLSVQISPILLRLEALPYPKDHTDLTILNTDMIRQLRERSRLGRPFNRAQSADPLSLNYSPRRSRRDTLAIPDDDLASFSPGLAADLMSSRSDAKMIIEGWIANSPETHSQTDMFPWNVLTENDLWDAFRFTVHAIEDAESGQLNMTASRRILDELEEALEEDRLDILLPRTQVTVESQRSFRALAEVSYYCLSRPLGTVLHLFFTQNLRGIVNHNSIPSLVQWCHAILRANMRLESRHDCFDRLFHLRPDFISELDRLRASRARGLADLLRRFVRDSEGRELLLGDHRRSHRDKDRDSERWSDAREEGLLPRIRRRSSRSKDRESEPWRGAREISLDDAENPRRLRRLAEDVKFHEAAADKGKKQLLRLTVGERKAEKRGGGRLAITSGERPKLLRIKSPPDEIDAMFDIESNS